MTTQNNTLTLTNFRHHGNYHIELVPNCIHLISGDSGAGKSTLFQALLWVLFGKMKKVTPRNCPAGTRAIVTLKLGNRKLTRKSNTDEFTIELENGLLKGTEANGYIESWLGAREFWVSTSYLIQKKQSAFLTATPAGKLEILNNIIFMVQNPGDVIEKADVSLESIRKQRDTLKQSYDNIVHNYSEVCSKYGVTEEEISKGIVVEIEGVDISMIPEHYKMKQQELELAKKEMIIIESKLYRIRELEDKLRSIPDIEIMEKDAKEAIEASKLNEIHKRDMAAKLRLEETLKIHKDRFNSFVHYPEYEEIEYDISDIETARIRERQVEEMKKRFSSCEVEYSTESLNISISSLKEEIDRAYVELREYQDYIHNLGRWDDIQKELKVFNLKLSELEVIEARLKGIDHNLLDRTEKVSKETIEAYRLNESRRKDLDLADRLKLDLETYRRKLNECRYYEGIPSISYSRDQIEDQRRTEIEIKYSREMFSKLNVEYDEKSLKKELIVSRNRLTDMRDSLVKYEHYKHSLATYDRYQIEIQNLELRLKEAKNSLITHHEDRNLLEQQLSSARRTGEDRISEIDRIIDKPFISCPHCDKHVYWSGENLVKTQYYDRESLKRERDSILTKRNDVVITLESRISRIRDIEEHNRNVNSIIHQTNLELEKYRSFEEPQEVPLVSKSSIEDLSLRLSQLESLRFIENKGLSSSTMEMSNANVEYVTIEDKLKTVSMELCKIQVLPIIDTAMSLEQAYDNLGYVSQRRSDLRHLDYMNKDHLTSKIVELNKIQKPVFNNSFDPSLIDRLNSKLVILCSLEYIEAPTITSEYMVRTTSNYNRKAAQKALDMIEKELSEMIIQPEIPTNITAEEGYKNLGIVSEYKNDIDTLSRLKREELNIYDIKSMEGYLVGIEGKYKRYQLMHWVIAELEKIKKAHAELTSIYHKEMGVSKIREMMIALEYSMYIEATNKINMYLDQYISELFTEPIKVKLLMFKTLKDRGRIKPSVNIQATCDDIEFDISSLSGGEDERLSLAITLALNKLSRSPFLILDETFGSLSDNDRERALKVLSKYGKSETTFTLCVNHGSVEGFYDRETSISKKL